MVSMFLTDGLVSIAVELATARNRRAREICFTDVGLVFIAPLPCCLISCF